MLYLLPYFCKVCQACRKKLAVRTTKSDQSLFLLERVVLLRMVDFWEGSLQKLEIFSKAR